MSETKTATVPTPAEMRMRAAERILELGPWYFYVQKIAAIIHEECGRGVAVPEGKAWEKLVELAYQTEDGARLINQITTAYNAQQATIAELLAREKAARFDLAQMEKRVVNECQRIAQFEGERDKASSQVAELREILIDIQWSAGGCPRCFNNCYLGHSDSCELGAVLARTAPKEGK